MKDHPGQWNFLALVAVSVAGPLLRLMGAKLEAWKARRRARKSKKG